MNNINYKKYKERLIVTAIIIALMFIIGFTSGGRSSVTVIERVVGGIFTPVISVVSKGVNTVADTVDKIINIPDIITENDRLVNENIALQDENRKLNDIIARSDYLKNEFDLQAKTEFNVVKANIAGRSNDRNDKFLIDKGSMDGISVDDTVIVGIKSSENLVVEGLVGKVHEVGDNWAKITLIIEDGNSIAFTNIRTQDGGILNSTNGEVIEGYMYNNQSDIIADDRLYTSGLGETYSPRIYIGRITNVISDEQNMKKSITLIPAVDFEKLSSVMVITGDANE